MLLPPVSLGLISKMELYLYHNDEEFLVWEYKHYGEKHGLTVTEIGGWINVSNGYECFRFKVRTRGKVRLLHLSNNIHNKDVFHEQFKKYISPEKLMLYIKQHGIAKTTNKFIDFTEFDK